MKKSDYPEDIVFAILGQHLSEWPDYMTADDVLGYFFSGMLFEDYIIENFPDKQNSSQTIDVWEPFESAGWDIKFLGDHMIGCITAVMRVIEQRES